MVPTTDYYTFGIWHLVLFARIQYLNIHITYYDSSIPTSVANFDQTQTLLKITEVARWRITKLVYISTSTNYTASLFPVLSSETDKSIALRPLIRSSTVGNMWFVNSPVNYFSLSGVTSYNDTKKVVTYDLSKATVDSTLSQGWYMLIVNFPSNTYPENLVIVKWQTS